ncbi:TolC family protein [Pedobacter sp. SAFR-022]|uniref:TolC family protein n=1 Tax=Pedobacter sp. SAFR-022 TaxID=3436861 RepID=UPI003F813C8D
MKNIFSIPRYFAFTCFLTFLGFAEAHGQHTPDNAITLTINQVWEKATAENKIIKMQDLDVAVSAEKILDAKAERLPEISTEAEYGKVSNFPLFVDGLLHKPELLPVEHTFYKVGGDAYLNLYNGHKTGTNITRQQILHEIHSERRNQTVSEIKLQAAAYYLDLQRSIAFKALMEKNIEDQERQLKEIRQLLINGVVLKSDVLRAELQLSRQNLSLKQINNDIAIARQKLNILMGEPDAQHTLPVELSAMQELPVKNYEEYLREAMARSYQNKISEEETRLSKLELKDVKANVNPKLGLFANYAYSYPQIQFYPYSNYLYGLGTAGIKASFSVDALYHNKHKVKAAQLELKTQELEHHHTQDQIRQRVNEGYLRYNESLNRIKVAETNVIQARENARIVNNTYFNQLSLVTDLLESNTQLLQTQFDLAAARIAAQLQYYQLQNIIGNL